MKTLSIFYTANIAGDLQLLPRLYRFISQLKAEYANNALLLDIGQACAEDVWHCDATKGQSTVIVMDGMGYHAINVSGYMTSAQRDGLTTSVSAGLITERHMWRYFVPPVREEDIVIAGQPTPAMKLCIVAKEAVQTTLDNRMLHLQHVQKCDVGFLEIDLTQQVITRQDILSLPSGTKPDATIAASVELIEDEARLAQKRGN